MLAEGAAALILEDLESAKRRGATILAEVIGYGSTGDAFRVTDQHEDGRGGIAAVKLALADAGLGVDDIDYISAHGTGTKENDSIESHVIRSVFGQRAYKIPVSSVKSMLGHFDRGGRCDRAHYMYSGDSGPDSAAYHELAQSGPGM